MCKKPQVIFSVKSLEDTVNIVTSFFDSEESLNSTTTKHIANFFGLNLASFKDKTFEECKAIVEEVLTPIYKVKLKQMENKVKVFQEHFNSYSNLICAEFEKIFRVKFNGIRYFDAYVNLNNVCPRYLNNDSFDICYVSSPENATKTAVHELIHFYWFDLFKEVMPEISEDNFEFPHPAWMLSEIAVDPIIYFSELSKLNFKQPAYEQFYKATLNGENLIESFRKLYKANSLPKFMERGLKILENNPELVKNLL